VNGGLFRRLVWRSLGLEGRAILAVLSVALGVAVFLAIRLANRAAVASFEQFALGVGTGADLGVRAEVGPLDERDLARLAPLRRDAWIRPVLEGTLAHGPDLEAMLVLGTDLVGLGAEAAQTSDRSLEADPGPGPDPSQAGQPGPAGGLDPSLLLDPDAVLVTRALARAERLQLGDPLDGMVDGRAVRLRVAGLLPEAANRPPLQQDLLVMDLPAAQRLFQRPGQLDRLDLGWRPGRDGARLQAQVAAALPRGWILEAPEHRAASARTMSAAFRLNLTVLSLGALAVGAYLLFQAFDAAVTRRRETWALLQAMGCPPGRILALVLAEAALLGSLGSLLGLLLGWAMAQGAVRGVARTMTALYGASSARQAAFQPGEAGIAFLAGSLTCLAAAWWPARRAAATPPVQLLARGAQTRPMPWRPMALVGLALLGIGLAVAFLPHPPPGVLWPAYTGAALVLLGGSLASPALLPALGWPGRRATASWTLRLCLRPLCRPTGRHGFAAAALAVAVGLTVGMGVMVRSFEATVQEWIGASLKADLFVTPLGSGGATSRHRLPEALTDQLAADPAVAAVDRYQQVPFTFRGEASTLATSDFTVTGSRGHLAMIRGGANGQSDEVLGRIHRDGLATPGAVASETFVRRFGLRLGDRLALPPGALGDRDRPERQASPAARTVILRGVYADYGNERGSLILDRPVFLAWFHDARCASLALYLRPGADAGAVARRLARGRPGLQIRSNLALRAQVERIFQQTFAITYALEVIGLAVALGGLAQSLAGLALARRGELWTLRALGAGDGAVARVLLGEGLGVALAGSLGGLALGLALSRILVQVLNPQAFGWTLSYRLPWAFLGGMLGACLLTAAAVLLPVARGLARLAVDRQLETGAT
jgi:putative ABC transport system permease protein